MTPTAPRRTRMVVASAFSSDCTCTCSRSNLNTSLTRASPSRALAGSGLSLAAAAPAGDRPLPGSSLHGPKLRVHDPGPLERATGSWRCRGGG
jgi:hypothetical protein